MATKRKNNRTARKRALRLKHGIKWCIAFRDGMTASRRGYGRGIGR